MCLTKSFNLFVLARYIPQQLKDCRTTLISKTDNPHPDAEDYRPITVASGLYRLFSKIVTRRLENSFSLHPRQKALRSGTDGAFDNTGTMMTIIREAHLSTFSASSQKSTKYQWTTDHMRDVQELSRPAQEKPSTAAGSDGQARSDMGRRNHAEVPYPGLFTCMMCSFTECVYSLFIFTLWHATTHDAKKPLGTQEHLKIHPDLNVDDLTENKRISENKEISENNRRVIRAKGSTSNKEALENNRMVTRSTIKRATVAESRSAPPLLNRAPAESPEVSIVCATIDNRRQKSSEDASPDAKRMRAAADQGMKFTCKSGRVWTTSVPSATQTRSHNIVREMSAVLRTASGIQCPGDAIKLLITPAMVNVIVQNTNKKAEKVRKEWNEKHPDAPKMWKPTDEEEIYAFIGLLLISGVFKSSDESVSDLWSLNNGRPIFRSVMTEDRFKDLLRFCRFDDNCTRAARLKCDKLAAFRDMWTMFRTNLKNIYKPSAFLTVDEQLVSTRARSSLKQYMPCKPGKYGIKIFWCCDAETSYPLAGEIYAGKQPGQTGRMNVVDLVKRLVRPWCGKGRNITMDNFFTSIPLAEDLLAKKTTIVGTLRRKKKEVPSELTEARGREVGSSLFCFDRQLTLVSYIPKRKKSVLLLSTMHHDDAVYEDQEGKPDIVLFYNETKSGTSLYGYTHASDAEDYRPITVASYLYRLFSKIVTRRLEDSLSLHPRQKAFRSCTDGAFDNTSTLMTVIREAHNCSKELNIVSINLAKAFDTINHTSIDRALCMPGLDLDSRALIAQMGVRQGDPISPLLFNLVMDELIERLEQSGVGFKLTF
ncbi:PiggyBac transposable element-derived protein 4 [Trichinella nelsoni]|uniref:PiggyBac transposable element-derived protein 4 n=1 Tax=Trichinella nelsoni TaxID=6336 RepID=A0A0V0SJ85_9BILA|nr:PiggyBac transposable element-derived protein 4 [Trichinella nelsoni]